MSTVSTMCGEHQSRLCEHGSSLVSGHKLKFSGSLKQGSRANPRAHKTESGLLYIGHLQNMVPKLVLIPASPLHRLFHPPASAAHKQWGGPHRPSTQCSCPKHDPIRFRPILAWTDESGSFGTNH